jgi:hypothetical protein
MDKKVTQNILVLLFPCHTKALAEQIQNDDLCVSLYYNIDRVGFFFVGATVFLLMKSKMFTCLTS